MNTRLQVEHPVTELITGLDLVELQMKIARGEELNIRQEDLKILGHALELRVYAEDPMNDFLSRVGSLEVHQLLEGEGIRVDNVIEEVMDVPIHYDPLLSKLITYAKTRDEAIHLVIEAIQNYKVKGIETTLPFGTFICKHEAFISGDFDTNFVKKYFSEENIKSNAETEAKIAALVALRYYLEERKIVRLPNS